MAGTYIKFDTREIELLVRRLNQGATLKPSDRTQLLKNLSAEIEDQTKERFATKESPDGSTWKDIADTTREYYATNFPGAEPPLVVTGGLRDSIESRPQGQWAVIVGATKEYAAVHQWGWEAHNIEARPYLGISPENEESLARIAAEFVAGLLSRSA